MKLKTIKTMIALAMMIVGGKFCVGRRDQYHLPQGNNRYRWSNCMERF